MELTPEQHEAIRKFKAARKAEREAPGEEYFVEVESHMVTIRATTRVKATSYEEAVKKTRARIEDIDDPLDDLDWEPGSLDEVGVFSVKKGHAGRAHLWPEKDIAQGKLIVDDLEAAKP